MNGNNPGGSAAPKIVGFNPPHGDRSKPMEPIKLFDNFYYVGNQSVGSFVIDTGDGLIMIDAGTNEKESGQMVNDMKRMGLDPGNIQMILISHEHGDHYGGVPYLKKNVCPDAKVAMSVTGWYHLQERVKYDKPGGRFSGAPESVDMFLKDGQQITLGHTNIQIVHTPGHSPGCLSFIVPVTDNGEPHMLGTMGGTGVKPDWEKAFIYKSSVEYFQKSTREAKCDVGLGVHFWGYDSELAALRARKPGDPNPFIIGTEKYESVYLQSFRDRFQAIISKLPPEERVRLDISQQGESA